MLEIENKQLCESCFSEISESPCPFCGFSRETYSPLSSVLPIGYMLRNRYRIGSVIGQGGFGITYRAYDTKYNEIISIKEYYPSSLAIRSGSTLSVSATSLDYFDLFKSGVEKFCNEAKLVSRFNGNPNIVSVYEYFYENETAYFSMEFLKGETLKSYIDNNGVITPEEALDVFLELSSALIVAHSADVLHRDISPDNIMLLVGGGIKLIDFGAARQVIANDPKSKSVILKDGFAPLEQYIRKGNQGPWTDIYSLGATIYYALTKERLDNPMTRLEDNDERFMSNKSTVNEQLWNIIHKCIQIKYQDRYQNAFELKDDLKKVEFKPSPVGYLKKIKFDEANALQQGCKHEESKDNVSTSEGTICILPESIPQAINFDNGSIKKYKQTESKEKSVAVATSKTDNQISERKINSNDYIKALKKRHFKISVQKPIIIATSILIPFLLIFLLIFTDKTIDATTQPMQEMITYFVIGFILCIASFIFLPVLLYQLNFKKFCSDALIISSDENVLKEVAQMKPHSTIYNLYFNSSYLVYYYPKMYSSKTVIRKINQIKSIQPKCITTNYRADYAPVGSEKSYSLEVTFIDNLKISFAMPDEETNLSLASALQQAFEGCRKF